MSVSKRNDGAIMPVAAENREPVCSSSYPGAGGELTVLIADDSDFYLSMVSDMVNQDVCPSRILTAKSGREALEIFHREAPDIILLDWEMPGMSGIEVAKKIRSASNDTSGKYPYIIIITGRNAEDSFFVAFRNGADDFLHKPLKKEELAARVLVGKRVSSFSKKLVEQAKEMEKVSRIDSLTELYNRKHGEERLIETINLCSRKKKAMAVCYCDLDRFKFVNDTWGHEAGDTVLRAVSSFLRSGVRISDTAVRWGGDEFVLIFPETGGEETLVILNRIRDSMKDFSVEVPDGRGGKSEIKIGISIGCAWGYPKTFFTPDDCVAYADKLLYEAKAERENNAGSLLSFASAQIPGWELSEDEKCEKEIAEKFPVFAC